MRSEKKKTYRIQREKRGTFLVFLLYIYAILYTLMDGELKIYYALTTTIQFAYRARVLLNLFYGYLNILQ